MSELFPASRRAVRTPVSRRWIVLGIVSVILHLIALNWVHGNIRMPAPHDDSDPVIAAVLHAAPPAPPLPAPVPVAKVKPRARPVVRPIPPAATEPVSAVEAAPAQPQAGMEAPGAGVEPGADLPVSDAASAPTASEQTADAAPQQPDLRYKVSPPPSAELKYDVQTVPRAGNPMYGHGTINWQSTGSSYTINGEAGVLFITALIFKSEGTIDSFGVAPVIYSEKRFRKSETNTHFHRERNTISFSASTTNYPRKGGEQDRASIIWQLAGIGRGDSEKFAPDAEIDIFVAGVRDGETWRIRVIGQEDIEVGAGRMRAWHVVRAPRPGSYDQQLDIWLAPQHEWYPVKLRYTETNGDYLDMTLSDLRVAQAR